MLQDVGYIRLKALLDELKTTEAILNASKDKLLKVRGIGPNIAASIQKQRGSCNLDRELDLIEAHGVKVTTIFEENYPENLKSIYDPPLLLYVKGSLDNKAKLAISIVGSRRCTQYGLRTAEKIAGDMSNYGATVVSGMARGIDTAAHKGALKCGGRTIAVLGSGLCHIYPPENRRLADDIASSGALVSEFPMEMPPHKNNFPRRNRIINGLSRAIVVVEAAKKSGALITADLALEEGREVFAVPGQAGYATSEGTNNLIKEGAKLVENAKDILDELRLPSGNSNNNEEAGPSLINANEKDIYGLLSDDPCNIDSITERLSIESKQISLTLLGMEMRGVVKQLPGKLYIRS